ncbi:VTC domain-containing protein [Flavobacteriaceae bacterium]|nr:VTC domain-containing protein [Flavobacteriaceae bacterium]
MKYLRQCIQDASDSARIERKFIMTKGQCILAESLLRSIGFKRLYKNRTISSIYFDDAEYSCLRANIDGSPSRDKIRFRSYNGDYRTSVIETKHKRGDIGYKSIYKLDDIAQNQDHLICLGKSWCNKNLFDTVFPSSRVDYVRSYFIRGKFRATVDYKIRSSRIVHNKNITSAMFDYSVIEFKYSIDLDEHFREIYAVFSDIALRNTKSSKYSNSLIY